MGGFEPHSVGSGQKRLYLAHPSGITNIIAYVLVYAMFQSLMDKVLGDLIGREVICYTDDLIIFSSTPENYAKRLERKTHGLCFWTVKRTQADIEL